MEDVVPSSGTSAQKGGHRLWVRLSHWLVAISIAVLLYSGFTILQAHPRLYWGETGNVLTEPLFELPISPNYKNYGLEEPVPFFDTPDSPVTANRAQLPFNENGWARSLHFLVGWTFLLGFVAYMLFGLFSGHIKRNLLPSLHELRPSSLWADVKLHMRLNMPADHTGPPYGPLQKLTYVLIVLIALPLMILTGMTMSPALVVEWPILLDLFGGAQSARTIHFFTFAFIAVFLLVHLAMIVLTGTARQLRGMIMGK